MIVNTSILITRIKDSDFVRDLRCFYREEPWACTMMLAVGMFVTGGVSWLFVAVTYVTWPDSLYLFLSIAAIIWGARGILNWISKE